MLTETRRTRGIRCCVGNCAVTHYPLPLPVLLLLVNLVLGYSNALQVDLLVVLPTHHALQK